MVSVCLPSDALLQHSPPYLGFSYLGVGYLFMAAPAKDSHCSLTLDEGYLLTAALPDLQRGIAPLGPPTPAQPQLLGLFLLAACHPSAAQPPLATPINSMKRKKDRTLKDELPRSVGAQYATGDQWRNNSRKNEEMEPKQKQHPVVDVTGDRSKV